MTKVKDYPSTEKVRAELKGRQTYFILKIKDKDEDSYVVESAISSVRETLNSVLRELSSDADSDAENYEVLMIYNNVNWKVKSILNKVLGELNNGEKLDLENILA